MSTPAFVVIYQNTDFVSGLLEELLQSGLVKTEEVQETLGTNQASSSTTAGSGELSAVGSVPMLGKLGAAVTGKREKGRSELRNSDTVSKREFTFLDTYFLQLLKATLDHGGHLKMVTSIQDARELKVGDFVSYTADFQANQVDSFLDIATPDLVAEFVRHRVKAEGQAVIDGLPSDIETIKAEWERFDKRATMQSDIARAVTAAIRADFRSDETTEFYGRINAADNAVIAVTICDREHFVTADRDRILDGQFTVLGKVVSSVEEDVPVLARNKVLNRVNVEFLESVLKELKEQGEGAAPQYGEFTGAAFSTDFSAKVDGESFKVLPIAIFV